MKKRKTILIVLLLVLCILDSTLTKVPVMAGSKVKLSTENFSKGILQSLKDAKADSNKDGYLSEKEIANITYLNVKNQFTTKGLDLLTSLNRLTIQSYTKEELTIQAYRSLYVKVEKTGKTLHVSGDYVMSIEIANDTLESFDASKCGYLESIHLTCSKLKELDITGCKWLEKLVAVGGKLTNVDLSANNMLQEIQLYDNKLKKLEVSNCAYLTTLYVSANKLKKLDLTANENLTNLEVAKNQLTDLDITKCNKLFSLYCSDNPLGSIDLSAQTEVVHVFLDGCNLKKIDLSKCKKLGRISLSNNDLTTIDCSKNKELFNIQVINNKNLKKLYIKDKKNVAKKVLTKTKVTKIKRISSTAITVYFKKNPYAKNGYVFTTRPLDCISGIVDSNATQATVSYIKANKKVYVVLYTLLDINDTCVYGTEYVSDKKY